MRVAWVALVAGCGFHTAGTAVEDAAAPDAEPEPDVGGFALEQCPASYNLMLGEGSRYRLIAPGHPAWEQSESCNRDLAGATHLVILETQVELERVVSFLMTTSGIGRDMLWVGAVQLPDTPVLTESWYWVDGTVVSGWRAPEPNDGGGMEDGQEQFVRLERNKNWLVDASGGEGNGALCECDGKPVAANLVEAIRGYR